MSVATRNPFALLDSEDNSRPSSPAPASKLPPQPTVPSRGTNKSRGGPASRGGKYYARGGAPRETNPPAEDPVTENQRKSEGVRGSGRGRGRDRGGAPRGGRRPFDRHSQTGKTDSDKKLHQGWGGDDGNTELKTEEAATVDAAAEATPESPAAEGAEGATTEGKPDGGRPRREREPEEEDTTLTLDQYFAQKKDKDTNVPKIESTRQANEGADGDIWKGAVVLSKNEDDDSYYVGKSKATQKPRPKKEEKVYIEIDRPFERSDRGGRGRGRGDRGRGASGSGSGRGRGGRGGRQNGGAPDLNVDDQTAFPSLS